MSSHRSQSGVRLPFRKTTVSQQTSYVFHTVTGDITLTPLPNGEVQVTTTCTEADSHFFVVEAEGLTMEMLRDLHRADNREVENNLRQARAPVTAREKEDFNAWRNDPDHPERWKNDLFPDAFQRWNIPLDSLFDDKDGTSASDRDPVMFHAWEMIPHESNDERDRVRTYVSQLSPRQQQIYWLYIVEERTLRMAAAIMGITRQRAGAIQKQLVQNLYSHFHQNCHMRNQGEREGR